MICNLGDPMSLRHPVAFSWYELLPDSLIQTTKVIPKLNLWNRLLLYKWLMSIKMQIRGPSPRCLFPRMESFVYFSESHRDSTIALRVEILCCGEIHISQANVYIYICIPPTWISYEHPRPTESGVNLKKSESQQPKSTRHSSIWVQAFSLSTRTQWTNHTASSQNMFFFHASQDRMPSCWLYAHCLLSRWCRRHRIWGGCG